MKHLFRALETATYIGQWFISANADGKITVNEMAEFVTEMGRIWGVKVSIETTASGLNTTVGIRAEKGEEV